MNTILYNFILTIGSVLIVMAISIGVMGYFWHLIKSTVERTELQLLKDNNVTLE